MATVGGGAAPVLERRDEEWDVQAYLALRKSGKVGLRTWLA